MRQILLRWAVDGTDMHGVYMKIIVAIIIAMAVIVVAATMMKIDTRQVLAAPVGFRIISNEP